MSTTKRIAETLAAMLSLPLTQAAARITGRAATNAAGTELPSFGLADRAPVPLTEVKHPDGRMSSYPPVEHWADWVEWDSKAWPERVPRRYTLVPTICFNCEAGCGLLAYVDKTTFEIRKFEGNPQHPGSRGRNCAKGPATHNQIYDPERILYPLKRVGERGEGKWKRVTWDEVMEDVAGKMAESRRSRRDGIVYHVGRPGEDHYANRVVTAWGVDGHNSHTNVCSASSRLGYYLWAGFDRPSPDYANARCIVLISAHLETGHYFNPHAQRIMEAKKKGAKIITFDPRLSNTAAKSDVWLPTWPGSETTVLLAIARELVASKRYDRRFVERWVDWPSFLGAIGGLTDDPAVQAALPPTGIEPTMDHFEAVFEALYAGFSFERAAADAQVDVERIREAAEAIAAAGDRLAAHNWRSASIGNRGGWQVVRALFLINVLTGSVGTTGGTSANSWNKFVPKPFSQPPPGETWNDLHFPDEWPLAHYEMSFLLPHMLLEGRGDIDVYFTRVYNPLWTNPDGFLWHKVLRDQALMKLHVALTPTWNESAWFADYVLPMGHAGERHDLMSQETHSGRWIGFRQPVRRVAMERAGQTVEFTHEANPGEVWEEAEFWVELSGRMDPDGSLGVRQWFESPHRPGKLINQDEYWSHVFEKSVPGLPEAAAAENLSPLAYMRKYGAFEIDSDIVQPFEDEVEHASVDSAGRALDAEGTVVGVVVDGVARKGFGTPSRRLEMFSATLSDWGWKEREYVIPWPLPSHVGPPEVDREAGQMVLLPNFRLPTMIHTRSANAKWLVEISHNNPAWLHPQDAARIGVRTGDLVRIDTETGWFVDQVWVTEGIKPGVVAVSHHLGRWRLDSAQGGNQAASSLVRLEDEGSGHMALHIESMAGAFESSDPDTSRIWWKNVGVHQNLTHGVHPDPISGAHCWLQRATSVRRAAPEERYGEVHVDTNASMEVYRAWKAGTRPASTSSPDGTRRPYWFKRPLKPTRVAYQLPKSDG